MFQQQVNAHVRLTARYHQRVENATEKALRSLIDRRFKSRIGKAMSSVKDMRFPNQAARWAYAMTRVGTKPDECYSGAFDSGLAWVNNSADVDRLTQRAASGREPSPRGSMLLGADVLGIDCGEIADCIIRARNAVREPERAQFLQHGDASVDERENAHAEADRQAQRDLCRRSPAGRRRTLKPLSTSPTSVY